METSEAGYVNEHGQVNLGAAKRTGPFGIYHYCYRLHCLYCGETYGAHHIDGVRCENSECATWHDKQYPWGRRGGYELTTDEKPESCYERRQQVVEVLHAISR